MGRMFLGAIAVVLFAGCSTFNRDWKSAASTTSTNVLAGRWQGTWLSDANGHTEQLRCLVTQTGATNYSARFQAKYKRGFRFTFNYTVPLVVESGSSAVIFRGEADLGWAAGGVYCYEGNADSTNFFSIYECKYDRGTFRMTRPGAE